MWLPPVDWGMATGGAWTASGGPGLAVTTEGPTEPRDRLPQDVSRAVVEAAAAADLLVVDRRRTGTRTEQPGTAEIAGRDVLVVPRRPGARPRVECYSSDDPATDPAVELVRRTVELDATTAAHYSVAAAVAVASDGEPSSSALDDQFDEWTRDSSTGGRTGGSEVAAVPSGHPDVSPSTAELAARRDSVDAAAERVLDGAPETAAPLAFCGLAGVVEPLR